MSGFMELGHEFLAVLVYIGFANTELEKAYDQVLLVRHQALLILEMYVFYGPVLQSSVSQTCPVKT